MAWAPLSGAHHYLISAEESVGNTTVTTTSISPNTTLTGLKSGTTYTVSILGLLDAAGTQQSAAPDTASSRTAEEVWQLVGGAKAGSYGECTKLVPGPSTMP